MSLPARNAFLRIFVVENHPDTLLSLRIYLEDLGHTVGSAQSVGEALEKLPAADCQLLLCDVGLPDGTGWDLLLRANLPPRVFAVAMSGFGRNADSRRSRDAGYRHHLLKPFKIDEIDQILLEAQETADVS